MMNKDIAEKKFFINELKVGHQYFALLLFIFLSI